MSQKRLYEAFCLKEDHTWESMYFIATSARAVTQHLSTVRRYILVFPLISCDDPADVKATDLTKSTGRKE